MIFEPLFLIVPSLSPQSSVDEAEALVKRHEELEARLAAQEDSVASFAARAEALERLPHYAADQ